MTGNLDILFINPPYERLKGFSLGSVPNGILGLATYLNKEGYNTLVYDADTNYNEGLMTYNNKNRAETQNEYAKNVDDDSYYVWHEIRDVISDLDPRYIGITLKTPTIHSSLKIAKIAKELGKIVLAGGPHVNIIQEKALELENVDYVFFGEGEKSVLKYLKSYPDSEKLKKIRGIGFKNGKESYYGGFSERISDLDTLPFPERKYLIFIERYVNTDLSTIMASRGCPFKCTFCASVPIWGQNAVFRSPDHIISEIKDLHDKYKVREFRFFDDTFTAKKTNIISFCKRLIEVYGDKYFDWYCLSKVNAIDEDVLYWLRRAGCSQIHLGVESGSERILKLMKKGITPEQVEKAVNLARKYNFWVHTFFMTGLPYETLDDMRQTINFIRKVKPDSINLCTFTPYPGTELYDYCIENKLIEHDDSYEMFKHIGHHSTSNYFLENVSKEEYQEVLKEMLELTTNMSNAMTYRKFSYRLRTLTLEKFKRKIKLKIKMLFLNIGFFTNNIEAKKSIT